MVDNDKTAALDDPNRVVCVDEYGEYITFVNRLDTNGIDWIRANGERVTYEKEKKKS